MDQRERYRSTPPARTLDDMPLAAYGGTGMEDDGVAEPADAAPGDTPTPDAETRDPAGVDAASPGVAKRTRPANVSRGPVMTRAEAQPPTPGAESTATPSAPSSLPSRVIHLLRTSRLAAGAGFAVVILIGLVLLSSGGASPAATAATPTKGPTAAPTIVPPSGDASLTVSGAVTGSFTLTGLAGGQRVDATTVNLGWGDAVQATMSIAGPLDRGTRTTDERLVLTIGVLVAGQPVTFTSTAGECTIGMAQVGTKVQGSFTCHKLKGPDGKLMIEASGTYRS